MVFGLRVRSVVAPLANAVATMGVVGLALLGLGQTGERPRLVVPPEPGDNPLAVIGAGAERDPTGLTAGETDLVAPELLEAAPGPTGDGATPGESIRSVEAPAGGDAADEALGATTGESSAPSPPGGEPPATLALADGELTRSPTYDDPWPTVVAAMGRELEPTSGRTTRGVTTSTIRVSGLVAQTNVGHPELTGVCEGAAARFARANASGELSRRVEMTGCADDETDPGANGSEQAALIGADNFAIVPLVSPAYVDPSATREEHVPHVGFAGQAAFCGRDTGFGLTVTGATDCPLLDARGYTVLTTPVIAAVREALGSDTLAATTVVVENSARGQQRAASRALEAALLDVPLTSLALLPAASAPAPASWEAQAFEIVASGPTVVILDGSVIDGLPEALREAGFLGEIVWVGMVDPLDLRPPAAEPEPTPGLPGAELLPTATPDPSQPVAELTPAPTPVAPAFVAPVPDGLVVVSAGVDLAATSSPAWAALVADAAGVDLSAAEVGAGYVQGYLAADLFVASVAATPEPLTAESWFAAVNSGFWYPGLGSVACGGWWPAGHVIDHPCVSVARVDLDAGRLVSLLGLRETAPQFQFRLDG